MRRRVHAALRHRRGWPRCALHGRRRDASDGRVPAQLPDAALRVVEHHGRVQDIDVVVRSRLRRSRLSCAGVAEQRDDVDRQRGRRASGRQRDDRNSARDVRRSAGIRRCDIMSVSMTQWAAWAVSVFGDVNIPRLHAKTQIDPEADGRCCARLHRSFALIS